MIWLLAALTVAGVLIRPFDWPEAIWAVLGALAMVLTHQLSPADAGAGIHQGLDVYLFLTGMMLLSELARSEGVFDWVAGQAVRRAQGSPRRLFRDVYLVGVVVTVFLSNDATAVVLTPAVAAVARAAQVEPLPYLFICALVANAASFVLPISNPANLVLYQSQLPPLLTWLARFALPSLASIVVTYAVLLWSQRRQLGESCEQDPEVAQLSSTGKMALAAIGLTAVTLLAVSALGKDLGLPTCLLGILALALVCGKQKKNPLSLLKEISWSVLPMVAGLFVVVRALEKTGVVANWGHALQGWAATSPHAAALGAGAGLAFGCNAVNNLPAGLLASSVIASAHPPQQVVDCLLIGVDLGPNLSVTGSLATILWLTALKREGEQVSFWQFLKLGLLVMPPALLLSLGVRLLLPG